MLKPKLSNGEIFQFPRQCIFLRSNGSWPFDENHKNFELLYKIWSWYVIFSVGLTIYFQTAFLFSTFGDIMLTTENCCTTFMGALNFVRMIHLRIEQKRFRRIIEDFVKFIWIPKGSNPKVEKQCERNLIIFRLMSIMMIALIVMYCTLPLLELFVLNPNALEKPFPYKMIFFYDAQHGVIYILTYIFTAMAGFAVVTTLFAEDSLFGFFVTYTCGQLKLLQRRMENLIPDGHEKALKKYGADNLNENLIRKEYDSMLHQLIDKHIILINYATELDKFFSPIFFVNFCISSILICVVGFQIVTGKMFIGDYIKFLLYISSNFVQLFVLCINGETLIQNSLEISNSLYFCNWEGGYFIPKRKRSEDDDKIEKISYNSAGVAFNKKMVLIIMRSQKPLRITASKFSVLSLASLTTIISTSMSYFTLLQSFMAE